MPHWAAQRCNRDQCRKSGPCFPEPGSFWLSFAAPGPLSCLGSALHRGDPIPARACLPLASPRRRGRSRPRRPFPEAGDAGSCGHAFLLSDRNQSSLRIGSKAWPDRVSELCARFASRSPCHAPCDRPPTAIRLLPQALIVDPNQHAPLDIRRNAVADAVCVMLLGPSAHGRDFAWATEGSVVPFRDFISRCDQQARAFAGPRRRRRRAGRPACPPLVPRPRRSPPSAGIPRPFRSPSRRPWPTTPASRTSCRPSWT